MSILALDIGGTKIRAALVHADDAGAGRPPAITHERTVPTEAHSGGAHVVTRVIEVARAVMAEVESPARAIAIATAGVVSDGRIVSATNLMPGWAGTDLATEVSAATGLPVYVLGDVNAHGLGEATYGAGQDFTSSLTVAIGTGIGGALVVDGAVLGGSHQLAGHIGHVTHGAAAGLPCSCGRVGHIEPLASGSGVTERYEALTGEPGVSGKVITDRSVAGEPEARQVLVTAAHALGEVLGSAANLVDPGVIILSGSGIRSGQHWWTALREGFRNAAMDLAAGTKLVEGTLGDHAPLLGAAAHALESEKEKRP